MNDEEIKKQIAEGVPMVIAHLDNKGNVISEETYNIENISLSEYQTEQLAKTLLEACQRFYSDPENIKKYEEWKKKNNK